METTREAPSVLEDILQYELPALFRRQHLNRDVMIGLVGDRGGGKSIGGGEICLLDYMLQGEPCFANMQVKATFDVDDEMAAKYRLPGGKATFEAKPLDKHKFLRFDSEYHGCVFFTHEFNIWLADARRSNSNLNLETDDIGQELRKLNAAWIYDCIDENFVDKRIRDATDIFIRTNDTALTTRGMMNRQKQGLEFEWYVYAMTHKGAAICNTEKYKDGGKPQGPYYIRGKQLWGLIDTKKKERRERYKTQIGVPPEGLELTEGADLVNARNQLSWLEDKSKEFRRKGIDFFKPKELARELGCPLTRRIRNELKAFGIAWDNDAQGYEVDNYHLVAGGAAPA